jgi:ABC-type branched-subunit amino acid transport system substrate-binding protein
MPLTGPDAMESERTLDWAAETLNAAGGIGGRPVELVYKDTYGQDSLTLARYFLDDPDIHIVIGPMMSADVYLLAPLFIQKRKLLISPTATASDITRTFGKQEYFWRTVQSDVAQLRSILDELDSRNVKRISLLYVDTPYGRTFYQWAGFFTTELGMELVDMVPFGESSDFTHIIDRLLANQPEYVVTVAYAVEVVKIKRIVESRNTSTRLFFTDAAEVPYVITELGEQAVGLELMTPAADPNSGYEAAFAKEFGYVPYDISAAHYDAFILAACTLARQQSRHKESLPQSFKAVTSGAGDKIPWNRFGEAVQLILQNKTPDIGGASSRLEFDAEWGVDPTQSFYSLNKVETRNGVFDFWTVKRFSSDESADIGLLEQQSSAIFTRAGKATENVSRSSSVYQPGARKDLWAVIIATSSGWENYRHQADALAMYTMLKKNGLSDDRIILMLIDDIPFLKKNPIQGDVHHEPNGPNLRANAVIDYTGDQVTLEKLKKILLGTKSPETPSVLESGENSNLFIYIVDHGSPGGIPFASGNLLTAVDLSIVIDEMYAQKKYRQMFVMVEVCFGEGVGLNLSTPGVVYFTGASRTEASFGALYDKNIKQWLADDFTCSSLNIMSNPGTTIEELYLKTYESVKGSHVRLLNYANFGDVKTPIGEFIKP